MTNVDNSITIDVTMLSLCRDQGLGIKEENGNLCSVICSLLCIRSSLLYNYTTVFSVIYYINQKILLYYFPVLMAKHVIAVAIATFSESAVLCPFG